MEEMPRRTGYVKTDEHEDVHKSVLDRENMKCVGLNG